MVAFARLRTFARIGASLLLQVVTVGAYYCAEHSAHFNSATACFIALVPLVMAGIVLLGLDALSLAFKPTTRSPRWRWALAVDALSLCLPVAFLIGFLAEGLLE